jgi:hypothetical protein
MCPGAFARSDVRIHRLADDRVRELETVSRPQDRERDEPVGGRGGLVVTYAGQGGRLGQAGTIAEHRDGPHERARGRGGARQAQQHPLGDRGGPEAPHPGRAPRIGGDRLLLHLAQQRLEEEGVAAGRSSARRRELGFDHRSSQPALAQRHGRVEAQRLRPQHRRLRTGRQPSQVGDCLTAAGGGEDHDGEAVQPGGQVVQEPQGLRIGPVKVVDVQRDRALIGQVGQQPVQPMQHGEGAVRRRQRLGSDRRVEQRLR